MDNNNDPTNPSSQPQQPPASFPEESSTSVVPENTTTSWTPPVTEQSTQPSPEPATTDQTPSSSSTTSFNWSQTTDPNPIPNEPTPANTIDQSSNWPPISPDTAALPANPDSFPSSIPPQTEPATPTFNQAIAAQPDTGLGSFPSKTFPGTSTDTPINPLDNPPTPSENPVPTFTPPQMETPSTALPINDLNNLGEGMPAANLPPYLEPTEPAPADLSQLTANAGIQPVEVYNPTVSAPETFVVPSEGSSNPQMPTTMTSGSHHRLPILAVMAAVVVILLVAGASAYFILGIGQSSLPTVQPPLTNTPTALPQPTLAPQPTPQASTSVQTGSSSFGTLNGTSATPAPTKVASSAAEILRQRQQQASPSPK